MKTKKESVWKRGRRWLSGGLAVVMLLGSAVNSGVASSSAMASDSGMTDSIVKAASSTTTLGMPEWNGPDLLHGGVANRGDSLSEQMLNIGSTGGAFYMQCNPTKVWNSLKGKCIQGYSGGGWSVTFEYEGSGFQWFQSDDIVYKMSGYVSNSTGWTLFSDGTTGTYFSTPGMREWVSTGWTKLDTSHAPRAVISGTGTSDVRDVDYLLADMVSPGANGRWDFYVGEESGRPILWLELHETLRPANENITYGDLANLRLKLGVRSVNSSTNDLTYVTAQAVRYSLEDATRIGFQIIDSDWQSLESEEFQIITIGNGSPSKSYSLKQLMRYPPNFYINTPICDMAGNPVVLPDNVNVEVKNHVVDHRKPTVTEVRLDRKDNDADSLDATAGAKIEAHVFLSEQLDARFAFLFESKENQLTEAEKAEKEYLKQNVKLQWNVELGGEPVVTHLNTLSSDAVDANQDKVTVLVFEPLVITEAMTPQNAIVQPVAIIGAGNLHDSSEIRMEEPAAVVPPDKQFTLDTQGPVMVLEDLQRYAEDEGKFTIALNVSDSASGVLGETGYIYLSTYSGAPDIQYEYSFTDEKTAPDTPAYTGTLSGGVETGCEFKIHNENVTYYLHLRITNTEGMELDEAKGLRLRAVLTDKAGNKATTTIAVPNLGIDHGKPTLSLTNQGVTVHRVDDTTNQAGFTVAYSAADQNILSRVEYQWLEEGQTPADNAWTLLSNDDGGTHMRGNITTAVTGTDVAERRLVVRTYDIFENVTQREIVVTADMTRAVGRQELVGEPEEPLHTNDVIVYKPTTSDAGGEATSNFYTRAIVRFVDYKGSSNITDYVWVRVFDFAAGGYESTHLLENTYPGEWYCVRIDDNNNFYQVHNPDELADSTLPPLGHYGRIEVEFASSANKDSLIPVNSGAVALPQSDTTANTDSSFSFLHTTPRNDVYALTFGAVTDGSGNTPETGNYSYHVYYKFNHSMAGTRIPYSFANTLRPEWGYEDVDFENSYAVLLRADARGSFAAGTDEVTARQSLNRSLEQLFVVPDADKNGNPFTSGAYILQVHLAQRAGGSKDFFLRGTDQSIGYNEFLLLDASTVPETFGITDYTVNAAVVYDDNSGIPITKTAPAGDVLDYISVGVAAPTQHDSNIIHLNETTANIQNVDGKPAYSLETVNALRNNFGHGGSGAQVSLELKAIQSGENNGTWLGFHVGEITGIKYWNAGSSGDPASLSYSAPDSRTLADGSIEYCLPINVYPDWYSVEANTRLVYTKEALAALPLDQFAVLLGSNTVCYQLQMANGEESPVYQFQLNFFDKAPQIALDWEFVNSQVLVDSDTVTRYSRKYAEEILVTATDAYSPYGPVQMYLATYENNTWRYTPYNVGEPIPITKNGDGYSGITSTRKDLANERPMLQFICGVDSVGNAVCAYPILSGSEDITDERFPYGIGVPAAVTVESIPAFGEDGTRNHDCNRIVFNRTTYAPAADTIDYMTIQVDDGAPVKLMGQVDMGTEDGLYNESVWGKPNAAGVVKFTQDDQFSQQTGPYSRKYAQSIFYDLPYDPALAEGTIVEHTVTLVTYSHADYQGNRGESTYTFTLSAPNIKPYITISDENREAVASYQSLQFDCWPNLMRTNPVEQSRNPFRTFHSLEVYANKTYPIEMMDKYGQEYSFEIPVDNFPGDPIVTYSTTKPTTGEVTVTVTSQLYNLEVSESDFARPDIANGSVSGNNTQRLVLTFRQSSGVYVTLNPINGTGEEYPDSVYIPVDNIFSDAVVPKLSWSYTGEPMDAGGNLVYRQITVWVVDENGSELRDPNTGKQLEYTFPLGSKAGDSYTFSGYTNQYGMPGPDITATLAYNLGVEPTYGEDGTVVAPPADTWAPDLVLTGFALRGGVPREIKAAYKLVNTRTGDPVVLPAYENHNQYGPENVYTDVSAFLDRMSWGESFSFRVEVADESETKLFIKASGTTQAPSYASGASDTIEGVSLQGRTVIVSKNTAFELFVVDSHGNASRVTLNVTNLGGPPAPKVQQVVTSDNQVRIYLEPPANEYTDVKITNPEAVLETEANSAFRGRTYLEQAANGKVTVYYSFVYEGDTYTGAMEVQVAGVDDGKPEVVHEQWSANFDPNGKRLTNQEISAQFALSSGILRVEPELLSDAIPDGVAVSWLENRLTIVYEGNAPAIRLRIVAMNQQSTVLSLPAVTTIDTVKPTATVGSVVYDATHLSASVTVRVDEPALLRDLGGLYPKLLNLQPGITYSLEVRKNGALQLQFTDRAGNLTQSSVTIDALVAPTIGITVTKDGKTIDPETDAVDVGDSITVTTSREAAVYFNGTRVGTASANSGVEITVTQDAAGLYPSIRVVDAYGNASLVQLLRIPMGDRTPPVILLGRTQISAPVTCTQEELEELLLRNLSCSDETTPASKLTIALDYQRPGHAGIFPVTCSATDEAGNTATKTCLVRLYDGQEPQVYVRHSQVPEGTPLAELLAVWEETRIVAAGQVELTVVLNGEPYKLVYMPGIRTAAQLKNGAEEVTPITDSKQSTYTLNLEEAGYYTFLLTTQSHQSFRFVLYVEENR